MRKVIIISILILLSTIVAQGQSNDSQGQSAVPQGIKIGGNVYGGGNKGKVAGNTNVTVKAVDEVNNVFGGARMANVGGRAYVNIDGEDVTGDILIPNVYGGNDSACQDRRQPERTDGGDTGAYCHSTIRSQQDARRVEG